MTTVILGVTYQPRAQRTVKPHSLVMGSQLPVKVKCGHSGQSMQTFGCREDLFRIGSGWSYDGLDLRQRGLLKLALSRLNLCGTATELKECWPWPRQDLVQVEAHT